jgi:hypothetical protein
MKHRSSLATKVNKLLFDYPTIDHQSQTATSAPVLSHKQKTVENDSVLQNLAVRVSAKIEESDVRDAVRLAASSDTLAAYDDDTASVLCQLHSSRTAPTCDSQLQPGYASIDVIRDQLNLSHHVILSRLGGWTRWPPTSASQGTPIQSRASQAKG